MSNPRIIAVTASAALIAGVGAAGAVYAVDLVTSNDLSTASSTQAEQSPSLQTPRDDSTTVYRAPSDEDHDDDDYDDEQKLQPAPPTTQWNNDTTGQNNSNTSKSS